MAYNIDSVEIRGRLLINIDDLNRFNASQGDGMPEGWEGDGPRVSAVPGGPDGLVQLDDLPIYGSGSGWAMDDAIPLLFVLLAKAGTDAEIILCWEGGDSYSGYRIRDGAVTCHEVIFSLGDEVTP